MSVPCEVSAAGAATVVLFVLLVRTTSSAVRLGNLVQRLTQSGVKHLHNIDERQRFKRSPANPARGMAVLAGHLMKDTRVNASASANGALNDELQFPAKGGAMLLFHRF